MVNFGLAPILLITTILVFMFMLCNFIFILYTIVFKPIFDMIASPRPSAQTVISGKTCILLITSSPFVYSLIIVIRVNQER